MSARWPQIWHWGDDESILAAAIDRGEILAIPTESSYGLAADPLLQAGVDRIFDCKGRPRDKPLPVVLGDASQLERLGADPASPELVELASLWPAPLTVIVPIRRPVPASAGRRSLAVRVPAHARLRALLQSLDRPLTATSANPAGSEAVSEPMKLRRLLADWPSILIDAGDLPGTVASTILQPTESGYRILRPGAISGEWLQTRLSRPVFSAAVAENPADESAEAR